MQPPSSQVQSKVLFMLHIIFIPKKHDASPSQFFSVDKLIDPQCLDPDKQMLKRKGEVYIIIGTEVNWVSWKIMYLYLPSIWKSTPCLTVPKMPDQVQQVSRPSSRSDIGAGSIWYACPLSVRRNNLCPESVKGRYRYLFPANIGGTANVKARHGPSFHNNKGRCPDGRMGSSK